MPKSHKPLEPQQPRDPSDDYAAASSMDRDTCAACGVYVHSGLHVCNRKTLEAIDAAMRSDPDEHKPRTRSEIQRFADGLELLRLSDDSIEE